jgi:hypothetical protein
VDPSAISDHTGVSGGAVPEEFSEFSDKKVRGQPVRAARVAGIELGVDGNDLVLEASAPPPAAVLDLLSRNKPGIVALLRLRCDGWSAEDWPGIAEFDGGLSRVEAEACAFACCVRAILARTGGGCGRARAARRQCWCSDATRLPRSNRYRRAHEFLILSQINRVLTVSCARKGALNGRPGSHSSRSRSLD